MRAGESWCSNYAAKECNREKIKEYINDKNRVIRHMEEYLNMMEAFSSKGKFSQIKENIINQQKTGKDGVDMTAMDVVLDEIEKDVGIFLEIKKLIIFPFLCILSIY